MSTWCTANRNGITAVGATTNGLIGALFVGSIYSNSDKNEKVVGEEKKNDQMKM